MPVGRGQRLLDLLDVVRLGQGENAQAERGEIAVVSELVPEVDQRQENDPDSVSTLKMVRQAQKESI